jgi:hypothetical protein
MLTLNDELHLPPSGSPEPTVERAIGKLVATAVGILNRGLLDWAEHGGLRRETKVRGGDIIAQLYDMKLFATGSLDFDATAREYGKRALREFITTQPDAPVISEAQIDQWVEMPLDILAKVVAARVH